MIMKFLMNNLPPFNNIYGYIHSHKSLIEIAKIFRNHLGLLEQQVYIYKSQFDGDETLNIRMETYDFETQSLPEGNKWLFNDAVAGDIKSIKAILKQLSEPLIREKYEITFEIYDDNFEFLSNYPE